MTSDLPTWGTQQQAAAQLGCHVDTIRRMITRGEIEARRFGPRLIRVNLATLGNAARPLQYTNGDAA